MPRQESIDKIQEACKQIAGEKSVSIEAVYDAARRAFG